MYTCKDCKKEIEERVAIYFIDEMEGPIYLCKYCAKIRKDKWDSIWKETMKGNILK